MPDFSPWRGKTRPHHSNLIFPTYCQRLPQHAIINPHKAWRVNQRDLNGDIFGFFKGHLLQTLVIKRVIPSMAGKNLIPISIIQFDVITVKTWRQVLSSLTQLHKMLLASAYIVSSGPLGVKLNLLKRVQIIDLFTDTAAILNSIVSNSY